MSEATALTSHGPSAHGDHDAGHHHHDPHLAHHFDTMEQQYDSGKLGMWVFLATELLMFGGLFCGYAVYRANNPEVFINAANNLDTMMGAINTAILLASSLSMAWAVRCAQISKSRGLIICLLITLLGGAGFMMIKAIEYNHKFEHGLGPGVMNAYNTHFTPVESGHDEITGYNNAQGLKLQLEKAAATDAHAVKPQGIATTPAQPYAFRDPNAGNTDAVVEKNLPRFSQDGELAPAFTIATEAVEQGHVEHGAGHGTLAFEDIHSQLARQRLNSFFGVYYCMTGLHGVHVLVGMALIFWVLYRSGNTAQKAWIVPLIPLAIGAYFIFLWGIGFVIPKVGGVVHVAGGLLIAGIVIGGLSLAWMGLRVMAARKLALAEGEFSEHYFAPVDLVGLYWHLVDLIWIFLFPLLYLIHGTPGT